MSEQAFIRRASKDWETLERYADRLDRGGLRALPESELPAFIRVYRKVCGDLAQARTRRASAGLIARLNALVARVHLRVYAAGKLPLRDIGEFLRYGFPRAVRSEWRFVAASAALFVVPAILAFAAAQANPDLALAFAPPGYLEQAHEAFGESFGAEARPSGAGAAMTSFYISNNVQVSFFAFALGALLGLGSVFILVQNGALLGGVAAGIQHQGLSYNFWSFVASHASFELPAIVLSGAAGLRIGYALLNPGPWTRRAALVEAGRKAGLLMFGVVCMLVAAALLEAWVSPSPLPNPVKLANGALLWTTVLLYLAVAGRGRPSS